MNNKLIPLTKSFITGAEYINLLEVINSGNLQGGGKYTQYCENLLENELNVNKTLLTTSCTSALEISSILLNLNNGDEVIVPSFTFVSTAGAFSLHGGLPKFCDIRADTLNIDENKIENLITAKTKAIVVVHYAGISCEMDKILEIASKYNLTIIEDNAHGLFGKYKDKYLGSFGDLSTQSFDKQKNFTCGEGGALIINNNELVDRAEIIRDKGTNRQSFLRNKTKEYTWVDLGSNYYPSDLQSAFLFEQLKNKDLIQSKRKKIFEFYYENLKSWAIHNNIKLPYIPHYCESAYHLFYLIMPSEKISNKFIYHLANNNISSSKHYLPLNLSLMGKKYGGKEDDCPISEDLSLRLVRLPFFTNLNIEDLNKIVEVINIFKC